MNPALIGAIASNVTGETPVPRETLVENAARAMWEAHQDDDDLPWDKAGGLQIYWRVKAEAAVTAVLTDLESSR